MKNTLYILTILLILGINMSCKKDSNEETYDYVYTNDYIRDIIQTEIDKGTIGNHHLFVMNEETLEQSEIEGVLTSINSDDIISIRFIDKEEAKSAYPNTDDGVVKINYYVDDLLKPNYYNIDNVLVFGVLNDLIIQGKVVRYPLIVLDGVPLRGADIKANLDGLEADSITEILVLDLSVGLSIYGQRAINGVVIISTNGTN